MQPLEEVLGVASLAFCILLIVAIVKRVATDTSRTPFLILQQFAASRRSEKGVYVTISGRPAGLISYIRSVLGLSQVVKFELTGQAVKVSRQTLTSYSLDSVPVQNIGSCHCGYKKSPGPLVLAILMALFGWPGALSVMLQSREAGPGLAILLFVTVAILLLATAYLLSKRMELVVETGGGTRVGVEFKPGVVEGVAFGKEELVEVMAILQALSIERTKSAV